MSSSQQSSIVNTSTRRRRNRKATFAAALPTATSSSSLTSSPNNNQQFSTSLSLSINCCHSEHRTHPYPIYPRSSRNTMENMWSCECVPICNCVPSFTGFRPLRPTDSSPSYFASFHSLLKLLHTISNKDSYFLLMLGVTCCVAYSGSYNSFAELTGIFTQAVMDHDKITFFRSILQLALASIIGAVCTTAFLYIGERLTLGVWRRQLIARISDLYYQHAVAFQLSQLDGRIVDADQRIGSDVTALCESLKIVLLGGRVGHTRIDSDIFFHLLISIGMLSLDIHKFLLLYIFLLAPMFMGYIPVCISCVWFSVTLWNYAGSLCVFAVYLYFILFVLLERPIIERAREINKKLEDAMGTFRFSQTYFRLHSETVALLHGHDRERSRNDCLFRDVINLSRRESRWNFAINLNANIFYWGAGAVSYIIPGFILGNETDVDTFVAAATMISLILYQLAYLIQLSQELSKLLASSDRVMELFMILEDVILSSPSTDKNELHLQKSVMTNGSMTSNKKYEENDCITFDNVILMTPAGRILFPQGISFKVQPRGHCNILIMGPSGIGKSSLVRCLGDLWPVHSGKIMKPYCGIFHVPQRPYLMYGTLRAQLAYPSDPKLLSDSEAEFLLSSVRLPCLIDDLEKECSWSQILSLGEQQLLIIGRVLFHKPSFVVLDECTSAMDEDIEQEMYRLIIKMGVGILSIAHRSTLVPFHHKLIKVYKDGNYAMETIQNNIYNEI